jgi:heptosyltransferase-2
MPVDLGPRPRILVIKLAGLGDLLLTTPMLRALRARYPAARLNLLTTPESAPLLRDSPLIDHIHILEKYAFDAPLAIAHPPSELARTLAPLVALRREGSDAVLLVHHLTLRFGRLKHQALVRAIAGRLTVGLENGWGDFLDLRVPDEGFGARHEAEYALALAEAVDAPLPASERELRLADLGWQADSIAPPIPGAHGAPLIAIHPGGGSYSLARRWPAERFAEVAAALHSAFDATCLLVGGAEERELHTGIRARLGSPAWARSLAGQTDPQELARQLATCALFIGNDSLPMHLAAMVGVPVVAVFGPSNASAWGPYAPAHPERVAIVRRTLPCSPCLYRGHALGTPQGCPPRLCLTELPVSWVLLVARRMLRRAAAAAQPAG